MQPQNGGSLEVDRAKARKEKFARHRIQPPMPNWCPATVTAKKVWAEGLFTLTISASGVKPFEPGQFLHLAIGEGDERVNRPYSVASPHGGNLEFFIVLVEDGQLTPKLWQLEPGHSLQVSDRAAGSFTLRKTPDAELLWLISTGTGLAPYIAMLRENDWQQRFRKVIVVHGVRHYADLAYTGELQRLEQQHPSKFMLLQTLTREQNESALHGRIPQLLESGQLESKSGEQITADNSAIMLCGNPAMLDEMEEKLGQRGMKKHRTKSPGQIVLERYW